VKKTDVTGSSPFAGTFFDAVCLSFWDPVASRNKTAIWMVNQSIEPRSITLSFSGLTANKTFRKKLIVGSGPDYSCTIQDYGIVGTATPPTPSFPDTLWGRCMQVYIEQ
jgi:hypothetical protein